MHVQAAASGSNLRQAQRRLDRWLRHLAWIAPLGRLGLALPERP